MARKQGRGAAGAGSLLAGCVSMLIVGEYWVRPLRAGGVLGAGWWLSAVGGLVVAAGAAALWVIARRYRSVSSPAVRVTEMVLGLPALVLFWPSFWHEQYLRDFSSPLWAGLLGYGTVSLGYFVVSLFLTFLEGSGPGQPGQGSVERTARLRFPGAAGARAWRRGSLVAVNGTVTWLPRRKGIAGMDLTVACRSLGTIPPHDRSRRRRPTTVMTAEGLVELDVSPRMIAELLDIAEIPPDIACPFATGE